MVAEERGQGVGCLDNEFGELNARRVFQRSWRNWWEITMRLGKIHGLKDIGSELLACS